MRPVYLVLATVLSVSAQTGGPTLSPLDPGTLGPADVYGNSVALDEEWAVVGAPGTDAAFVYRRSGSGWALVQTLTEDDPSFGSSVAVDGLTLAVGAPRNPSGAVYVYHFDGDSWVLTQRLEFSSSDYGSLGRRLDIDGGRLAVGAPGAEGIYFGGRVELYDRGVLDRRLTLPFQHMVPYNFGRALALDGDRLLVGAMNYGCCLLEGPEGAAFSYVRVDGDWVEAQTISPSAPDALRFGYGLAMEGGRAVIGWRVRGSNVKHATAYELTDGEWVETQQIDATGALSSSDWSFSLDGDRLAIGTLTFDAVRVYTFDAGWTEVGVLQGTAGEAFGNAVALSGGRLIIGAPAADGQRGAAYVADLSQFGPTSSVVVDGPRGLRYLGVPAEGVTIGDLAAQNLVRGVPGYYPNASPNLWTAYDADEAMWLPSTGEGEELRLGYAFRWFFYDRAAGNPDVSVSRPLPFTLSTDRPVNDDDVIVELNTTGSRFNYLANPFGRAVDLTDAESWPGAFGVATPLYVYDPVTRSWDDAPTIIEPWGAVRFRAKGPRKNGAPRYLRIPASAQVPEGSSARTAALAPSGAQIAFRLDGIDADGRPLADAAFTLVFDDDTRAAFDVAEDVEKFQPPATSYALVGSRSGEALLGLDARPFAAAEVPIALDLRGTGAGFTLSWEADGLPPGAPVTLVDLVTGGTVDVRRRSSVTFEAASASEWAEVPLADLADPSAATDRFVLRIGDRLPGAEAIDGLVLDAPRPNPAAGAARVAFTMPEAGPVRLVVLDVQGREVAVALDREVAAGRHEVEVGARALAAGTYLVRLEAAGDVASRSLVVVR